MFTIVQIIYIKKYISSFFSLIYSLHANSYIVIYTHIFHMFNTCGQFLGPRKLKKDKKIVKHTIFRSRWNVYQITTKTSLPQQKTEQSKSEHPFKKCIWTYIFFPCFWLIKRSIYIWTDLCNASCTKVENNVFLEILLNQMQL